MAKYFCRFCGHEFYESLLSLCRCPSCEYADVPWFFQVLEWENSEVIDVWSYLESCFEDLTGRRGEDLATLYVPKTEGSPWEKLILQALIYDQVYICEQWKLLFSETLLDEWNKYIPVVMRLFEEGILFFVDDPETMPRSIWHEKIIMESPKIAKYLPDFQRIIQSNKFVDLFTILNKGRDDESILNYWMLDRYANFLTASQLHSNSNTREMFYSAYHMAYPNGDGPDTYNTLTQSNRYQTLAVLLDLQLSLHHDWVIPIWKNYSRLQKSRIDYVNEIIFDGSFLFIPKEKNVDKLLDIRNSNEFTTLRKSLIEFRGMTVSEYKENLLDIKKIIDLQTKRINKKVKSASDYTDMFTSGIAATAGSLLGGIPGAIIGGIAGTALGKLASDLTEILSRKRNKHWTMLISEFQDKNG